MTTPVCLIDSTGCHVPQFSDCLTYYQGLFQGIFGADIYIAPDSQDGQQIAIFATAINDTNAMCLATYNAFSPSTAQGTGLSSVIKINGMQRLISTYSTADLIIAGRVGTVITNGIATDVNQVQWLLPASVTIPASGQITITATCAI